MAWKNNEIPLTQILFVKNVYIIATVWYLIFLYQKTYRVLVTPDHVQIDVRIVQNYAAGLCYKTIIYLIRSCRT